MNNYQGLRVLVVEDNEDAAVAQATLLRLVGHAVRVALDGRAALEAAESFRPHVVLLDLSLPVMDGREVARRIRQTSELPMKVIAVTGWGSAADRDKTTATGFDHHLLKPVDFFTLQSTLRSIASEIYAS